MSDDSDDEYDQKLAHHVRRKQEQSAKWFKIECDWLDLGKSKAIREENRDKIEMERGFRSEQLRKGNQKLDCERLEMDKTRLELEAEERRVGIEEWKQQRIVLTEIARKLL